MTTEDEARFEFRIWANRLDDESDRLRSLAEPAGTRESTETYFVSPSTVDTNPKARADRLDIKVLVGIQEGFEQWGVRLQAAFPVAATMLETELFPLLGLTPPPLEQEEYSLAQLVAEVVPLHPDLAAVEVTKRRQMYTAGACIAEITRATIAGQEFQTVAVESADLDALSEVRRALGLEGHDNISYPRAIRDALGGRITGGPTTGGTLHGH